MSTDQIPGAGAIEGMEVKKGGLGSRAQMVALSTLCAVLFLTFLDNTIVSVGLACWRGEPWVISWGVNASC